MSDRDLKPDNSLAKRYPPRKEPPGPLVMPTRERREPKGLKRGKPIAKRNPERLAKRRAETFSDCARMARLLPCAVCDRLPPSDPAHVVSRGAGGKDWANVAPLCRKHHDAHHQLGALTFEKRYGISLAVVASYLADMVREHECYDWPKAGRGGRALCAVCLTVLDAEELTP